jgi:hypothetical protein
MSKYQEGYAEAEQRLLMGAVPEAVIAHANAQGNLVLRMGMENCVRDWLAGERKSIVEQAKEQAVARNEPKFPASFTAEHYVKGCGSTAYGIRVDTLSREELIAIVGYMIERNPVL